MAINIRSHADYLHVYYCSGWCYFYYEYHQDLISCKQEELKAKLEEKKKKRRYQGNVGLKHASIFIFHPFFFIGSRVHHATPAKYGRRNPSASY